MSSEQDKNAFLEKLYIEMKPLLINIASLAFSNQDIAEDLVQNTFAIAQERIEKLIHSPNPEGWLVKALKLIILEERRRRKKDQKLDLLLFEDFGSDNISLSLEFKYGDMLESDEMALINRHYKYGQTIPEIARDLGISENACKKRIQRARDRLRNELRKIDGENK